MCFSNPIVCETLSGTFSSDILYILSCEYPKKDHYLSPVMIRMKFVIFWHMSSLSRALENSTPCGLNSSVNRCGTQRQWRGEKHKDWYKFRCTMLAEMQSSWARVRTECHRLFFNDERIWVSTWSRDSFSDRGSLTMYFRPVLKTRIHQ
jgi:hypothetical protein